jgi:glutamate 5-kinase
MSDGKTSVDVLENARLIVVKIGSVIVRGHALDQVNQDWMDAFAQDIKKFMDSNKKVVVVSSGGVALGRKALGISEHTPPQNIPLAMKQAASSVGQYHIFNGYYKAFAKCGLDAGQVLLTMGETENRRMSLNARDTLFTLLNHGVVPVINENDTVSTGEIRFGDNDRLSVRVAQMIGADAVILFSTTDGLYTDNPDNNPQAEHMSFIDKLGDEHIKMAGEALPGLSTGGMKSKIDAALSATKTGIHLIITDGQQTHTLEKLRYDNSKRSSLFYAQHGNKIAARKMWIGAHMRPNGSVIIDDGALDALHHGKSLLPIGVRKVKGDFKRGDVIEIQDLSGKRIGMGISAYNIHDAHLICCRNSKEIASILGETTSEELIHRNDMVLEE